MNNQPPPNGAPLPKPQPKQLPTASLTPPERKIWLASHNAPADMMLISIPEFAQISGQLVRQQMRINATRLLLRKVEPLVDGSITNLQTLANLTDGGCDEAEAASAVIPIVHKTAADLSNVLEAIRANLPPKKEGT